MATDTPQGEIPERIELPLVWVAPEDLPIELGNQFLIQFDGDNFFLSVGQVSPPTFLGTVEERFAQAQALSFVPVRTLGRYSMNRRNVDQLVDLLIQMRANFDEQVRGEKRDEPGEG
jgi:hypothetical protein